MHSIDKYRNSEENLKVIRKSNSDSPNTMHKLPKYDETNRFTTTRTYSPYNKSMLERSEDVSDISFEGSKLSFGGSAKEQR